MRTVIYARYSSQLQNSRSIDDQLAVCRERADREGWPVVGTFTDAAISGAAGIDEQARPGLNDMLAAIEAGGVDQVLAESTDRIARHQGDAFAIRERMLFAGTRLFTLSDGEVTDFTATIRGLLDAQFRKDLGAKIRRGQRGTVSEGRSPAGLAYGYRKANRIDEKGEPVRGLRVIDPDQAEIVRRIFTEYAAGLSPRAIAGALNAEGVPGPRGGVWRTTTIAGDRKRQNGMLQNRLYAGMIVHNRTSKVVDPRSRRTLIRPNAADQWISEPAPALRIVDEQLWESVQAVRARHDGVRPELVRRPRHMLSGLAFCGLCGGGWNVIGQGRWGCGLHRDGGGCANNRTIKTSLMEERVLAGLKEELLDPELVAVFVREYHSEYARRAGDVARLRAKLERRHADAAAKVERLVLAIANGADEFVEIRAVLSAARAERDSLAAQLADIDSLPVVALHPTVVEDYRRQVADLTAALAGTAEHRAEVVPMLRKLIDRVTVMPATTPRGVTFEVSGKLSSILRLAAGTDKSPIYANG